MWPLLLLLLIYITPSIAIAQDANGEIVFEVKKEAVQPKPIIEKGLYYYKLTDNNVTDTAYRAFIRAKGDTLEYYPVTRVTNTVLRVVGNGSVSAKDESKKLNPYVTVVPIRDSTGVHFNYAYNDSPNRSMTLYNFTKKARPKRYVAITGFLNGGYMATYYKMILADTNTTMKADTSTYKCIRLIGTAEVRPHRFIFANLFFGKKVRAEMRDFRANFKGVHIVEYYLRQRDLLPVKVIEYAPVKKEDKNRLPDGIDRVWMLSKAIE